MKKHKVPVNVRSLADRYFCEQCDRLGIPRPEHLKPVKARSPSRAIPYVDPAKLAKDNADGLAIEAMLMSAAPRMGLEAIWETVSKDL